MGGYSAARCQPWQLPFTPFNPSRAIFLRHHSLPPCTPFCLSLQQPWIEHSVRRYMCTIEKTKSFAYLLEATETHPYTQHMVFLINTAITFNKQKKIPLTRLLPHTKWNYMGASISLLAVTTIKNAFLKKNGEGLGLSKIRNLVDKIWCEFLNSMAKCGTNFPDCGKEKITTPGIDPPHYHLLMQCLTNSPTSTTCLTCIKVGS